MTQEEFRPLLDEVRVIVREEVSGLRNEMDRRFDLVDQRLNETNDKFDDLSHEMRQFRDDVFTREDQTIAELKKYNQEVTFFGVRLTRVEQHVGLI